MLKYYLQIFTHYCWELKMSYEKKKNPIFYKSGIVRQEDTAGYF